MKRTVPRGGCKGAGSGKVGSSRGQQLADRLGKAANDAVVERAQPRHVDEDENGLGWRLAEPIGQMGGAIRSSGVMGDACCLQCHRHVPRSALDDGSMAATMVTNRMRSANTLVAPQPSIL